MLIQHNKRPFADDDTLQLPYKQSRQSSYDSPFCVEFINGYGPEKSLNSDADHGSQLSAFQTIPLTSRSSGRPTTSVLSVPASKTMEDIRVDAGNLAEAAHGIPSSLSWARCNRYEADICFDPPILRCVPVGPDHQADIPVWVPSSSKNSSGPACAESTINQNNGDTTDKWVGTCIIPMPDFDLLKTLEDVGAGRRLSDCTCGDEGSVICVRQHVMEAREKLKMVLGKDNFDALGFSYMGENVASKWNEEEEVLFHEIVFANPPSLGKNFWNYLPRAFPHRSNKEFVSYYFNVFMLRKRARQNMSDTLPADSDNDEWQECDDCIFAMSDEDEENSVLDSLTNIDNLATDCLGHDEVDVHEEDGTDTSDNEEGDEDDCVADIPNGWASDKSGNTSIAHSMDENLLNSTKDQGVLDDSCMSYESQRNWSDSSSDLTGAGATQDHHHLLDMNRNDNLNEFMDHGYLMGHSWDMNYFCVREQQVDFSPTDVIEEVFQNETVNNNNGSSN
ncbi:uncharacterized protein LOC120266986 [Dioscorea cayenensis subsp. rotundata]|uniref:Uncharacterized protein LOC120266986 n=1 Tax=Dioscorea cayennensis subsp. rotundata TaxID=55577 RepID=A0AB40BWG9_DIOCR|nr:uncharacterized protein LOC120266986 [Dioscorea cayenensis subsp. rotundata]XP_039130593.1 uncharacterized protein LOC120266986 [Dioscorea cayenensis subsp. rotundata]